MVSGEVMVVSICLALATKSLSLLSLEGILQASIKWIPRLKIVFAPNQGS